MMAEHFWEAYDAFASEMGLKPPQKVIVLCQVQGCTKKSRGGAGGHCRTHGGGTRCTEDGCVKFSRIGGKCCAHKVNVVHRRHNKKH